MNPAVTLFGIQRSKKPQQPNFIHMNPQNISSFLDMAQEKYILILY